MPERSVARCERCARVCRRCCWCSEGWAWPGSVLVFQVALAYSAGWASFELHRECHNPSS
eukprot:15222248-Alexandrium_andersonii.AAC.1